MMLFYKIICVIYYTFRDFKRGLKKMKEGRRPFKEYGLTLFSGRQGSGKTMSLVRELERYRKAYPNLYIATNFGYVHENSSLRILDDILSLALRVKDDPQYTGLVIGWDEIQNDFDNANRAFPKALLRTITQQRKQAIKILATSQVFTRVAKPIREQTYSVVVCRTLFLRWTFNRWYDAEEFEYNIDNPEKKKKMFCRKKYSFIQHDDLRKLYDSYAVVDALSDLKKLEEKK